MFKCKLLNAIGARVRVDAGGFSRHHLVAGGSGFGCLPYEQHFGLGKSGRVDALEIRWPSGLTQRTKNPPANTTIRIVEGRQGWEDVYAAGAREWTDRRPAQDGRTAAQDLALAGLS